MNQHDQGASGLSNRALVAVLVALRGSRHGQTSPDRSAANARRQPGTGTPAPRPVWK